MTSIFLISCFVIAALMMVVPLPSKLRIACSLLVGALFLIAAWPEIQLKKRFIREGFHTAGRLLDKSCEGRGGANKIKYEFAVGDKAIRSVGKLSAEGCRRMQIGDQVIVTYLHSDPSINLPQAKVSSSAPYIYFVAFVLSIGFFFINIAASEFHIKLRKGKGRATTR